MAPAVPMDLAVGLGIDVAVAVAVAVAVNVVVEPVVTLGLPTSAAPSSV